MSITQKVKRCAAIPGALEKFRKTVRITKQSAWFVLGLILKEVLRFGRTYDRLMVTPGKNPWVELRATRPFLATLCSAYWSYVQKKIEAMSETNEEYQRKYWSNCPAFYMAKAREDYSNEFYATFDNYFQRALANYDVRRCLDVGCGGFSHILRLKAKHPNIEFVGIDVSRAVEEIWNSSIKPFHQGISFVSGSIARETNTLNDVDLFYTFGSLMCVTQEELEQFFSALKRVSRSIVGVIVETDSTDEAQLTIARGHSFFHNYLAYFRRFGFSVLEYTRRNHHIEANLPVLFAYFSTR